YISIINKNSLISDSKNLQKLITTIGIVFFFIFLLISIVISYSITNPIKRITKSMKEFNIKGNMTSIKMHHNDETKYLYDTFLVMIQRINHLIETKYEMEILFRKQQLKALQA